MNSMDVSLSFERDVYNKQIFCRQAKQSFDILLCRQTSQVGMDGRLVVQLPTTVKEGPRSNPGGAKFTADVCKYLSRSSLFPAVIMHLFVVSVCTLIKSRYCW